MKGSIVLSGMEYVIENYGKTIWENAIRICMFKQTIILPFAEIDDSKVECLINTISILTGQKVETILEEFGRYWITRGAKSFYPIFYKTIRTARQFILEVNRFHKIASQNTSGSKPPFFDYYWVDTDTLIMKYKSHRNLLDIAVGAIKGCSECFNEDLLVEKVPPDKIKITFGAK